MSKNLEIRLNQYIAACGVCSRRKADDLILEGQVFVNSKKISELGTKVNAFKDKVRVGTKNLHPQTPKYFIFYKPTKVLSTLDDPHERPTVADYLPRRNKTRLFPVGRLDWNSEGLMLITNDGSLAHMVMHPKFSITKVYHVKINALITDSKLHKLKHGIKIDKKVILPQKAFVIRGSGHQKARKSSQYNWLEIHITEGQYHIIRKIIAKLGYDVMKLKRVALGRLKMSGLKPGELREITPTDIAKIFR